MKKYLLSLMLLLPATILSAQNRNEKEPYMTKSLSGESIKKVEVETSGGSISVWGGNASDARVEVYVQANNLKDLLISKDEIQRRLAEDYDLNVSVSNNKVTAIAKPKSRNMDWKRALNISFKIYITRNVSTKLATSGGSISLKDLSGDQDFSTSGGSLKVENLSGNTKGRTSGGSIHVSNSKDEIDLATSGGSIHAEKCNGNIKLNTSGGSVNLIALSGNIKAHTSGGTIRGENIQGDLTSHTSGGSISFKDLSCSLETSTSGGHIDVSIKEFGKFVKINNSGGNVSLRMPNNKGLNLKLRGDRVNTTTLSNFNGSTDKDHIDGTLNGGGIPVSVNAGSGRVSLSFN